MNRFFPLIFLNYFFISLVPLYTSTSDMQRKAQSEMLAVAHNATLSWSILTMAPDKYFANHCTAKKTKRVAAGEHYRANALHRFLLGSEYRQLWAMPIEAEILDLKTEAGGLTPVMRVGGLQTKGLALKGADGRSYTFRGVEKDPTSVLPPDLHGTIADRIVQDQISSSYPAAPVVVGPIMEAAGILHTKARLVVMPNDESLGKFRREFAGLLGTFEEYPIPASDVSPGFAGASEILNHKEMWALIKASPYDRIDTRAFLKARLVDLFIGASGAGPKFRKNHSGNRSLKTEIRPSVNMTA
jgi:hypothetical protein